jgi:hypothetical protein
MAESFSTSSYSTLSKSEQFGLERFGMNCERSKRAENFKSNISEADHQKLVGKAENSKFRYARNFDM